MVRSRDGRVVVHKPASEDYGAELGSPSDAARLQVRLVGAANPLTPRSAGISGDWKPSGAPTSNG